MPGRDSTVFPLVPRHRLAGLPFGASRSRRRGRGADVAGSRKYVPGDPIAAIDWRASARLSTARDDDEFVVRERFRDEAPRVVVLCDRRPAMRLYPPGLPWLSKPRAVRAAVDAIVASAISARGAAGYLDFGDGESLWIPPRGTAEWPRIADRQADGRFDAPERSVELGLEFLSGRRHELPSGSFLFVVSDFLVPPPDDVWIAAETHRWDVVPVVVQDPVWEQSFPRVGGIVVPFVDPRDGRALDVRLTRRDATQRRRANEQARERLRATFTDHALDAVWLDTDDPAQVGVAFLEWAEQRRDVRRHR